jgi:hypothetical protein
MRLVASTPTIKQVAIRARQLIDVIRVLFEIAGIERLKLPELNASDLTWEHKRCQ